MRDVLRGHLGRSLCGLAEENRLAAAWTIACGRTLGARGAVTGYENGVVYVEAEDAVWMSQMISMRGALVRQMAQASGLRVDAVQFSVKRREAR